MPELPEVETMRRGLLPIVGRAIIRIEYPKIPYRPIGVVPSRSILANRAVGQRITAIDRIGKRVLVRLASGDSIVLQPKMAGNVLVSAPPSVEHTRIIFHLNGRRQPTRFIYWDRRGLGTVCLWTPHEVEQHLGLGRLGPDASIVDRATFAKRLCDCPKEVKVALLDQRLICGIGNIYASEILFAAKVHPQSRCNELRADDWRRVHAQTIRILREAIEKEGSTLRDGTYRNALSGEGTYQNNHKVYDRAGQLCPRCRKRQIVRVVQSQRSTYLCPNCQQPK